MGAWKVISYNFSFWNCLPPDILCFRFRLPKDIGKLLRVYPNEVKLLLWVTTIPSDEHQQHSDE
jgi:hypothetical protein